MRNNITANPAYFFLPSFFSSSLFSFFDITSVVVVVVVSATSVVVVRVVALPGASVIVLLEGVTVEFTAKSTIVSFLLMFSMRSNSICLGLCKLENEILKNAKNAQK